MTTRTEPSDIAACAVSWTAPPIARHDWPGNIRQLANELRRVIAMADDGQTLTSADLSPEVLKAWNSRPTTEPVPAGPHVTIRVDQSLAQAIDELERTFIERALESAGGHMGEAAQLLGLSRKGLFLKRRRNRPSTEG